MIFKTISDRPMNFNRIARQPTHDREVGSLCQLLLMMPRKAVYPIENEKNSPDFNFYSKFTKYSVKYMPTKFELD